MNNYEFTPSESAHRLLSFIYDFSDDIEEVRNELTVIEKAFQELRTAGGALESLSYALDIMLMSNDFNNTII